MADEGSVTNWLARLQGGDQAATRQLWERYFPRLVGLARARLRSSPRRAADEEDVALSAFETLCRNAEQGRFPELLDRDSLWRLLVVITARKAAHLVRAERQQKRGGGREAAPGHNPELALEEVLSREPTPEFAAEVTDEWQRLVALLGDGELESVALLRMQGYTVEEIGQKLGYAQRSIKRKLQVIRRAWEKEITP
jgi:DNA-directed RNA polymerase specialized sigma24 family protein